MNNLTIVFEDGQLLKVVFIKSPADYPKEDGIYFCCRSGFMTVQKLLSDPGPKSFMREINWYLQPIEGAKVIVPHTSCGNYDHEPKPIPFGCNGCDASDKDYCMNVCPINKDDTDNNE